MACFSFLHRRASRLPRHPPEVDEEISSAYNIHIYTYKELRNASDDFSPFNKIGEGGFGSVYKGRLKGVYLLLSKYYQNPSMLGLVKSCIGSKFTSQFGNLIADLAIDATTTVGVDIGQGVREVDIKKYIKVEKIPGGQLEDSKVLEGVMFNKDVAPGKMKRKIVNPRIILLDCPLEYKKGENQTNAELVKEVDCALDVIKRAMYVGWVVRYQRQVTGCILRNMKRKAVALG